MRNYAIELLQDENGKLTRTGLMFMVWLTFLMTMIGIVTIKQSKLADIPEPYVYITLVLCGTYTARKFLDDKFGKPTTPSLPVEPPVVPPTQ